MVKQKHCPSPPAARQVELARAGSALLRGEEGLEILYWMRLARALDERITTLFKQGKIPGVVFSQEGHEAASVAAAYALAPEDVAAPMHRDLGAYLLRGMSPGRVVAQAMGRSGSPSRGRDVNLHGMGDLSLGLIGFVSHLPQSLPVALGAALAFQYRGEPRVAMAWVGDGGSSEGGFHETLNFAAVLKAPLVIILENNQYAYSTPLKYQCAVEDLAARAAAYGLPGVTADGTDVLAVWRAAADAVARARRGEGPALVELKLLRVQGHAIHDPGDYVPSRLREEWAERDPIQRFRGLLREEGLLERDLEAQLEERIRRDLDEAVAWAEASPLPDGDTVTDGVYADA